VDALLCEPTRIFVFGARIDVDRAANERVDPHTLHTTVAHHSIHTPTATNVVVCHSMRVDAARSRNTVGSQLKQVIGRGSFGVVWRGVCRGEQCAVKVVQNQEGTFDEATLAAVSLFFFCVCCCCFDARFTVAVVVMFLFCVD
jgi:hypothetical protein